MQDAITSLRQKRAEVIISSQTPDNPFNITTDPVFVPYAAELAQSNHLSYIDHFHLLLNEYTDLGENATNALFPLDQHVHTSPEGKNLGVPVQIDVYSGLGADIVAQAIIRGAICDRRNPLFPFITNTSVAPGEFALQMFRAKASSRLTDRELQLRDPARHYNTRALEVNAGQSSVDRLNEIVCLQSE